MTASRSQVVTAVAPAADTAAAADLGHKLNARYVVFGQVHVNDNGLRVTGQIVSTGTDSVVGALKATGTLNDLFTLEDVLGNETRGAIGRLEGPQMASVTPSQQPSQPAASVQMVPYPQDTSGQYPSVYDTSPVYPVAPYDSSYYPYNYYPDTYYPYYPLYFSSGFGFERGFRGHEAHERGEMRGGLRGGFGGGFHGGVGGHIGVGGHVGGGVHTGIGGHVGGAHAGGHR
jgi:hypothetical protein